MGNFEKLLFKQPAYWVSELSIDTLVPSIFMRLICNPETNDVECDIIFNETNEISCQFFGDVEKDSKSVYLCALLGIEDMPLEGSTRYVITTDSVELRFKSSCTPIINWVNPDKPYQKWKEEKLKID